MGTLGISYYPSDPSGQAMFEFDHANEHHWLASPKPLATYILDPQIGADIPAGPWHLNHQQAHIDATIWSGVRPLPNLIDYALTKQGDPRWWTFENHNAHLIFRTPSQLG